MFCFRRNTLLWLKCSLAVSVVLSLMYCTVVYKLHTAAALHNSNRVASHNVGHATVVRNDLQPHMLPARNAAVVEVETPAGSASLADYHNYHLMELEAKQVGPGEHGKPYHLPPAFKRERDQLFKVNGFNARASDDIALNRSLADIRHPKCHSLQYLTTLPTVSVVVPFHNEHLSTLLRTAVSVINRSPSHLLVEVLLVDDASSKDFLGASLDAYLSQHLPKVRVLRQGQRSGLIQARLLGAKAATGDVILFLDSHTECNTNWLPPLLQPIQLNHRTVACPFIDVIDYETFAYRAQDDGARGAFDWELYYKRLPLTEEDKRHLPQPFRSPVMAGGLFAISRNFFWELGGYDPGLQIWGGEQYELSFKVWQCGGTMVDAPCSRVGHVYRKYAPFPNPGVGDYLGRNYKRVAEVWMDEYAEFLYQHRPHYRRIDAGDLTEQRALRRALGCKPFKWFMEEVAFDLMRVYPPVEPPHYGSGKVRSVGSPSLCLGGGQQSHGARVKVAPCGGGGGEQAVYLTWHKDVRIGRRNLCLDVSSNDARAPVLLYTCHGMAGNQLWRYWPSSQQLRHGTNERCLDLDQHTRLLFVTACDRSSHSQRWTLDHLDKARMDQWDEDR